MSYSQTSPQRRFAWITAISLIAITACSDNDHQAMPMPTEPEPEPEPVVTQDFDISVSNLTANQPLSPVALLAHASDVSFWQIGSPASAALEQLAEGGATSNIIALEGVSQSAVGDGAIGPGAQQTISIAIPQAEVAQLAIVTMLVNTNDAFTGVQHIDLNAIAVNDSMTYHTMAYDAGTEENSEAKGTIPGPVDMGEGFNAMRETNDQVTGHPGVISQDDGLATSVLNSSHRFDNPVASITITRKK